MSELFAQDTPLKPLAERMRPISLDDIKGQDAIIGPGKPLRKAIEQDQLHSMILWGPPGVGKTTLARLLAHLSGCRFETLSAVLSGVKEIRESVAKAQQAQMRGIKSVLFVDEVHRFNKGQQDAFLPYVEDGTIIFVGATTENPSFELNNALLSRARVYRLASLTATDLDAVFQRAVQQDDTLRAAQLTIDPDAYDLLLASCDGDARKLLGFVELLGDIAEPGVSINQGHIGELLATRVRRFDKGGDVFYEQISAMHESVRGSSPDGALYWLCRMLDGGCDPLYVARRLVRMASEDIGNADPRALEMCINAWHAQERLGSPEGELSLAQAVVYLASAPKSNAVYKAYNACMALVREGQDHEVPMHLRNAPTTLMSQVGMGEGYRYAHDEPNGYAAGEQYLPEALKDQRFYEPVDRGLEIKIGSKLDQLRQWDKDSATKRYDK